MFKWVKKFFNKKKQKKKKEESQSRIDIPISESRFASREYKIFLEEEEMEKRKTTLYEKACEFAEKFLRIEPDEKTKQKMEEAIKVTKMKVTPSGATSLAALFLIFSIIAISLGIVLRFITGIGIPFNYGLFLILFSTIFSYYLYTYPITYKRKFMTKVGTEIPFLILYMVVYLRESPNLEGALDFAARNLTGPLANDMRKILWDVEVGKYKNVDEALMNYLSIWKDERYIVEAFQTIRTALQQPENRRINMLDEAVRIILDGTKEKTKHYAQELKMPVMLLHALGILLPVIGMVLFPIIGIFMKVRSSILFIGFDVILPLALFFFVSEILSRRPTTFSEIRPVYHPDMPPEGAFAVRIGKKKLFLPVLPFSILVSLPFILIGGYLYLKAGKDNLFQSMIISFGLFVGTMSYFYLSSFQRVSLRNEVRRTEEEFTEALFQLGNHLSTGMPLEVGMEKLIRSIGTLNIKRFFVLILRNVKRLGMTLRQAIFDPEYGAILFYPSKLIESIMKTVSDAASKGVQAAATTMLSISRYLRDVHETQERIKELLEDIVSSLRFQAYLLTPIVAGVIVTLSTLIINIINQIASKVTGMEMAKGYMASTLILPWGELEITQGEFQLVAAIYFITTSYIVGKLISGIENGEDKIGRNYLIFYILWFGSIVYFATLGFTLMVFGPLALS